MALEAEDATMRGRTSQSIRRAVRGFSLVEMVVVLIVLGALAAVALPRYSDALFRYRVEVAAHRLAADLRQARSVARTSSADRTIAFDAAADRYTVAGVDRLDQNAGAYEVDLAAEPYDADLDRVALDGGVDTLTFDGYGEPDRGGEIELRVGPYTRVVRVEADSGRVMIQ